MSSPAMLRSGGAGAPPRPSSSNTHTLCKQLLSRARGRRAGERGAAALLAASSVADPDEAVEFGLGAGGGRGGAGAGKGGGEGEGGGGDGLVVAELGVVLAAFEMLRLPSSRSR